MLPQQLQQANVLRTQPQHQLPGFHKHHSAPASLLPQRCRKMDAPDDDSLPPTLIQDTLPPLDHADDALLVGPLDDSETSLTQRNSNRSNDPILNSLEKTQPLPNIETQQSDYGARTFHDEDTGAVNFGNLEESHPPSSPISVDGGYDNTRGQWRLQGGGTSQQFLGDTPHKTSDNAPETPALPRNPFAGQADAAAPMMGSQLFGQTQLMTSAAKGSPTSSRPSPNLLHHSISPNFMETSPLKYRTNVSSPTTIRTSSPNRQTDAPATVMKTNRLETLVEETPLTRFEKHNTIFDTPTARPSSSHQPRAQYEPMNKSQERKAPHALALHDSDSDEDTLQMQRRRLAARKRAFASENLSRVGKQRAQSEATAVEQPGAKRARLSMPSDNTGNQTHVSASDEPESTKEVPQSTRPSQKQIPGSLEPPSIESTKATQRDDLSTAAGGEAAEGTPTDAAVYDDIIPATSPVQASPALMDIDDPPAGEAELPTLLTGKENEGNEEAETSSAPARRARPLRASGAKKRRWIPSSSTSALEVEPARDGAADEAPEPSPEDEDDGDATDATAVPAAKKRNQGSAEKQDATDSSALTSLTNTPEPPGTLATRANDDAATDSGAGSPSMRRSLRRRLARDTNSAPVSPRKGTRFGSALDRLKSEPASESESSSASIADLVKSRSLPKVAGSASRRKGRLFEGMVFAISLVVKENKPKKELKIIRDRIQKTIEQAGGRILQNGLHELLQPATPTEDGCAPIKLQPTALDYGFAAVITNGHSRSFKYMQALALDIPCLPEHWLTECLGKGQIVDWQPFLLCSGVSSVLGNVTLSRRLPAYSAEFVRLSDTLASKARLFQGQTVLAVSEGGKHVSAETSLSTEFLMQGLGATVTKVTTLRQAKDQLRKAEQAGKAYDWICDQQNTEETTDKVCALLPKANKKKRPGWKELDYPTRLLHDELVIQSIVLGRVVDREEERTFLKKDGA